MLYTMFDLYSALNTVSTYDIEKSYSTETDYVIEMSLPGYKKEDIKISFTDKTLKISSKLEKSDKWRKSFVESYYINDNVNTENIKAKFEDGILKITLPKSEKTLAKEICIE